MPLTTPAAHLSDFVRAYLNSSGVLALTGIPTTTQIQRAGLVSAAALEQNRLEILVETTGDHFLTENKLTLKLTAAIGTETGQLTRATAHNYFAALHAAVLNTSVMNSYITSLSDADREGWFILDLFAADAASEAGEEENKLVISATFDVRMLWNHE